MSRRRGARVALLGFGVAGQVFHAPLVDAEDRLALAAVVTSSPERARAVRERYPSTEVLAHPDEVWRRSRDFDAVVIATSNESHVPLAREAVERDLAVVVDKPIAVRSADARGLVRAAGARGVPLTVFLNRRWDGDFLTLRDLVAQGRLGEVRHFESRFTWWQPVPRPGWKNEAPIASGGGSLYDMGPHLIDQATQLFGAVARASATLDKLRPEAAADDHAVVFLEHASGVKSTLWMSSTTPLAGPRFWLLGSTAGYRQAGLDPQESQLETGADPRRPGFGASQPERWGVLGVDGDTVTVPTQAGTYGDFYAAFARAVAGDDQVPVHPLDAVATLELIERLHADGRDKGDIR